MTTVLTFDVSVTYKARILRNVGPEQYKAELATFTKRFTERAWSEKVVLAIVRRRYRAVTNLTITLAAA